MGFWTKLKVVGGFTSGSEKKAEIYDLSGEGLDCPFVEDYYKDYGSVGTFINNKTLVYGGYYFTSDCYSYDIQVNNLMF